MRDDAPCRRQPAALPRWCWERHRRSASNRGPAPCARSWRGRRGSGPGPARRGRRSRRGSPGWPAVAASGSARGWPGSARSSSRWRCESGCRGSFLSPGPVREGTVSARSHPSVRPSSAQRAQRRSCPASTTAFGCLSVGAGAGIRTQTEPILSRPPLPIGLHQQWTVFLYSLSCSGRSELPDGASPLNWATKVGSMGLWVRSNGRSALA